MLGWAGPALGLGEEACLFLVRERVGFALLLSDRGQGVIDLGQLGTARETMQWCGQGEREERLSGATGRV